MIEQPHAELSLTATSIVRTGRSFQIEPESTLPWDEAIGRLQQHLLFEDLDAYQFSFPSPMILVNPQIEAYARASFPPGMPISYNFV